MGAKGFGDTRGIAARRSDAGLARGPQKLIAGLVALAALLVLDSAPAGASAEALCTNTWTGPSEASWTAAGDWSSGKVPTSSDVACIGVGKKVKVTSGTNRTGVVQGEGTLAISGGTFEVANSLEPSVIRALTLSGGCTLTGAASLEISGTFISQFESTMSGTGSTILLSGSTGEFERGVGARKLTERTLVNEGTFKLLVGSLHESHGALIKNTGMFEVINEAPLTVESGGATPSFLNEGTVKKVAASEGESATSEIGVPFENLGTVDATKGTLRFTGGGGSSGSNSWQASEGAKIEFKKGSFSLASGSLEDAIEVDGATLVAAGVNGENANVTLGTSGSLSVPTGSTTVGTLVMAGGTLTGAGTMKISTLLRWKFECTMSGTGTTVLLPGATGTFEQVFSAKISERRFVNEGSLTQQASGKIALSEGAELKNNGTLTVNSSEHGISASALGLESHLVNTGTLIKTEKGENIELGVNIENNGLIEAQKGSFKLTGGGSSNSVGSWRASEGAAIDLAQGSFSITSSSIAGAFEVSNSSTSASVTWKGVTTEKAHLELSAGTLTIEGTTQVESFVITGGELTGSGTLMVSTSFISDFSNTMSGSGSTILMHGSVGEFEHGITTRTLNGRTFINEGTLTLAAGSLTESNGAVLRNTGTVKDNFESGVKVAAESGGQASLFVNSGTFEKTVGTNKTEVEVNFENLGSIREITGSIKFLHPVHAEPATQYGGSEDSSRAPDQQHVSCGDPVNCATGNLAESQTDLSVGGRGVGLELTRTYNSQAAAEGAKGTFGYGWTSSFSDHLSLESKKITLTQADGGTVPFAEETSGSFTGPMWSQDTLSGSAETGYTLTLADQARDKFSGSNGRLESITDRDGNTTTLAYTESGKLEKVTDPTGRSLTFAYNGEGLVESVDDPMGHTVKYTYESGNLKSATQPAEVSLRWQFKYNASHEMTEMIDGRGGKTTNEYNEVNQVISQEDPAERTLSFEYEPFQTKIINKASGAVTDEQFTSNDEPYSITRGYGTASATTESFTYNSAGQVLTATDGNGHTTEYGYDAAGNCTSMIDPDKDETKWTYDATHDVETITTPNGETTTIKREAHGNPEVIERAAPASEAQKTKYKYTAHGELESTTNPAGDIWTYEYDPHGDRTGETDPEGNKRTWEYNEDSQEIAMVSPRGNAPGAEAAKFTTKIERDAHGRPLKITDPLGHITKYAYDGDNNIETITDGNDHATTYTYNADNEPVKIKETNGTTTETEYDGAGQVVTHTDGDKRTTKYKRNILEQVTEITDPLGHKTTREYDAVGNLTGLTDPAKRTTTYTYDPANRLTEVSYSSGKPATVKYEYNKDSARIKTIDGTGTTTYSYDQLDRLSESKDGHGDIVKYEYNLANEPTKITYPNSKSVTRAYNKDGRLEKITDWLSNTSQFSYDPDSNLASTTFPASTGNADEYAYNDADQMSEVKMAKGAETLAALAYTRDNNGQVEAIASVGLPGAASVEAGYDENNRLTKYGATEYKYDAANNPTTEGASENTYNEANELEKSTSATYTYNEVGERTKATPEIGPATTYGYDQAGDLTTVERPEEGSTSEIKDSYEYNGEGLRTAQAINGTTSYLTWDMAEELPLILSDEANSYIYGPGDLPVEQVDNTTGTVEYLHHDQTGSTRLLTGSTGTVAGKCTYSPYGTPTCEGTATTPLGWDGQYTSSDIGLVYMRARVYDPATAQFLSRDPLAAISGEPYSYAGDNPLNNSDPMGLLFGISLPSPEEIGEGIAGWGDTVTLGATNWVREGLGINNINACSGAYQAGGYAGLATAALIPGEGEAEIGAEGVSISAKIAGQMEARGWTEESIQEAIESGDQVQAVNKATGNPATRYINPTTGQSVVLDDVTKEVIHVGGPGFKYGPGSGDLP